MSKQPAAPLSPPLSLKQGWDRSLKVTPNVLISEHSPGSISALGRPVDPSHMVCGVKRLEDIDKNPASQHKVAALALSLEDTHR